MELPVKNSCKRWLEDARLAKVGWNPDDRCECAAELDGPVDSTAQWFWWDYSELDTKRNGLH